MTVTIAVAGKGGTGKTTFSGLLIRHLVEACAGRVLAIDADPSSNLHLVLGLPLPQTVGSLREEARAGVPAGMSRHEWLDYAVRLSVEEGADFDFLAMGRPEGQGCYCAANSMLRTNQILYGTFLRFSHLLELVKVHDRPPMPARCRALTQAMLRDFNHRSVPMDGGIGGSNFHA